MEMEVQELELRVCDWELGTGTGTGIYRDVLRCCDGDVGRGTRDTCRDGDGAMAGYCTGKFDVEQVRCIAAQSDVCTYVEYKQLTD